MVKEIRIYIEGDPQLRKGFRAFLAPLYAAAKKAKVKIEPPKLCGGRDAAYKAFRAAVKTHSDAFVVLLVDSEGPVNKKPWEHLRDRDGWESLGTDNSHCHLMVQVMESWFIADIDALREYYDCQDFNPNSIPRNPNVEEIDKEQLEKALDEATRHTTKGKYHKIRHASRLLAQIDLSKVRQAAPYCDRLFTTLLDKINPKAPS